MSENDSINIDQARRILGGRPGLVLGQALATRTDESSILRDLCELAASSCADTTLKSKIEHDNLSSALDIFADIDSVGYEQFRVKAERYLRESQPSFKIEKIAKVPWSAVVSLCKDPHIEIALRDHLASKPTSRKVTVLAAPTVLGLAALQLPVYKLLGNCQDNNEGFRVALSQSDYLIRVPDWRRLLNELPDFLREGGLIFLGTENHLKMVQDFLSVIYAGKAPYPNYLLFHETDSAGKDPVVKSLARGKSVLYRIKGTTDQLLEVMASAAGSQLGLVFEEKNDTETKNQDFLKYRSLAELVPVDRPSYQLASRRQEALEGLFRPNGTLWDAFLFDLDLPRSKSAEIFQVLLRVQSIAEKRPKVVVIRGEAAIGKTVIAKRLAVNLRRAGHTVLWCKKTNGESFHLYRELAKDLKAMQTKDLKHGFYMFWDDPWSLGLAPVEFAAALDNEGVDITIIVVGRNSDKAVARGFSRLPPIDEDIEIDFEITADEEAALPKFLLSTGVITDINDSEKILGHVNSRSAKDILCRLWYLLPDTREQLEKSLSDEYFRLESVDRLIENVVGPSESHGSTARRAYEAVAVTSGLGFGIPTEILVNALGINYSEWVAMCSGGKPLWGLLYPVEQTETDQYWYFTRNEVVTQILLRQINGGIGHAAEVRVLKCLVESCRGTNPVYRDFLIELLVRKKDKLKKIVTSREGRELYELAIRSFPVSDRTLVHHYAKWVSDEEHNNKEAYEILQQALDTADYPYAAYEERREFIHTSMAAVIVQRVKLGEQDRESGLLAIKRHLKEAATPGFFNLHTVHVQVNALIRLQQGDDPVSLDCFVEACRTLERAQQLAGAQGRRQMRYREALDFLEMQKKELAHSLSSFEKLKIDAMDRFESSGDQLLLEATALKGLIEASLIDKGTNYNEVFQFISKCQERILKKGQHMTPGLRQTRIDLIVRWRLQHDFGEMDWNSFLGDVRIVKDEPSKRDDILLLFYEAVACFHLRLVGEAQAAFVRLRALQIPGPLLGHARLYLRSKSGKPEQVQGVLVKNTNRSRVRLTEYGYDAHIYRDRAPVGVQDSATVHCWLSFSLQGPIAEFEQPSSSQLLLPA